MLDQVQQMLDTTPEITGYALETWKQLGPLSVHQIKENTKCFDNFEEDKHCYDEEI